MKGSDVVQTGLLTAEDLIGLPDEYELYEGVPRRVAAAPTASLIAANVCALLWNHVEQYQSGDVFGADASFRLARNPDIVFLPDAAFVRAARIISDEDLAFPFEGAPDLAVEVRSPGDRAAELDAKMRQYLAAGTDLGWAIDPVARTVAVYRSGSPVHVLHDTHTINGGEVLPGLEIAISRVFQIRSRRG